MAKELLDALAAGDPAALARAYDLYAGRLFAVARRLLGTDADAEECVQDTFVKLMERDPARAPIADAGAYLFAVLRHAAAARAAQRQKQTAVPALRPEQPQAGDLDGALQQLPAAPREVVALKIDGGLTFAEIAQSLGISANTAASRYRYALDKLKTLLKETR